MRRKVRRLAGLGPAAFLVLLTWTAAPAAAEEDYLAAARAIGDYLVETARSEGAGRYWAQYEGPGPDAHEQERHFPVSLYTGVSGTGYFLLNLWHGTKDKKYLEAAKGAGTYLVDTAKRDPKGGLAWEATYERKGRSIPEGKGLGLYVGNAGIGLLLAHLGKATGEKRFEKAARGAFARILDEATQDEDGLHWAYGARDIISGEAGIGLALLEMHRLTKDARFLAAARRAATWLVSVAEEDDEGVRWERHGWHDPAFSHGAAGIAFFLQAVGGKDNARLARGAARWIAAKARPCGESALLWDYYAGSPPEGKRDWVMNTWCHGAPGTIRLFLLLDRQIEDGDHLKTAEEGGGGIRHSTRMDSEKFFYYNPTYCCGAAGSIDAFSDLYEGSGDERWLDSAKALADDMLGSFVEQEGRRVHASFDGEDKAEKKNPYVGTGFMHGNAGVGHALLRLALLIDGRQERLILLPDHPFAHGKGAHIGK